MTTITIPRALLEQALESLWQMAKKFNFERLHESRLSDSEVRVAAHDAMNAIRAELAKPPTPAWHDAPETIALKAERDELLAALKDILVGHTLVGAWRISGAAIAKAEGRKE